MSTAILAVHNLSKSFGGVMAVQGVSFQVGEGELVALIGPNGAGKTTLFNMISCLIPPDGGEIWFKGERIDRSSPHELIHKGMARTFQNLEIWESMTVLENVMLGAYVHLKANILAAGLKWKTVRHDDQLAMEKALNALGRVGLADQAHLPARVLSYGQRKKLEIARAIVAEPDLLLLDEPMAGLNEAESRFVADLLGQLKGSGVSFLFIEHDMSVVMEIADRIVVLDFGKKIAEGPPRYIQNHPQVISAYLGEEV